LRGQRFLLRAGPSYHHQDPSDVVLHPRSYGNDNSSSYSNSNGSAKMTFNGP
jgi:hypothetical protein